MDLYIYTKAPDPAQACATSLADLQALVAALADPGDATNAATLARISGSIPDLGLNDDEPLTLRFYDDASTVASWSSDAGYDLRASLGLLTTDGSSAFTTTTVNSISGNDRLGTLALTTTSLKAHVQAYAARGAVTLWLQIRRTDSSGYRLTYVLMPVRVSEAVLNSATTSPDPSVAYLTAAEIAVLYEAKTSAYGLVPLLFAGNATDEQTFGYFYAEVATSIVGMVITAQNAPAGAALTVDLVDSSSAEQSKIATLAAAATYQRTIYATPLNLDAADTLRAKIKSVGTTTPGGWLMCYLITRPNY